MGMPGWWAQRRYGLFVHASLATVPAWAPIGQYAEWYWSHLGDDLPGVLLHPQPLVEVLAHHRDRWGHISHYDEFLPLLHFDHFDAEEWARLAVDAGMGYTVFVSKHHDGLCWWDAPRTDRTVIERGPARNVLAEYAAACERNDVVFGTYYSLLDWGDRRYRNGDYTGLLHDHVLDLVDRYGSQYVWGDGHWDGEPSRWQAAELATRVRSMDREVAFNDRWWLDPTGGEAGVVRTYEYQPPDDTLDEPWELCRGVASSFGHNRAERAEHHLSAFDIVSLYTEVMAKGGNLLLNVGPSLDGSIPELQAVPLRAAGAWIRRHGTALERSSTWTSWGDDTSRIVQTGPSTLLAVELAGHGRLPTIDRRTHRVERIEEVGEGDAEPRPVGFRHDDDGVHIDVPRRGPAIRRRAGAANSLDHIAVYRVDVVEAERPVELFSSPAPPSSTPLAPLVEHARAGDIIQLGDGVYEGVASVPPGVVVRGLGSDRTLIDGRGEVAVRLGRNARLEHLALRSTDQRPMWDRAVAVQTIGNFATILGCSIGGHVEVASDGATMRASTAWGLVSKGNDHVTVSRCRFRGTRWDVGISIVGGRDHDIDSCEVIDHLCAIRLRGTADAVVRGNDVRGRWWGVHLVGTVATRVHRNKVHETMRAVDVEGGERVVVDGNAVFDGDSGCVVQSGAADCDVNGNYWERCRIGLLTWDAPDVRHDHNHAVDLHETDGEVRVGP